MGRNGHAHPEEHGEGRSIDEQLAKAAEQFRTTGRAVFPTRSGKVTMRRVGNRVRIRWRGMQTELSAGSLWQIQDIGAVVGPYALRNEVIRAGELLVWIVAKGGTDEPVVPAEVWEW